MQKPLWRNFRNVCALILKEVLRLQSKKLLLKLKKPLAKNNWFHSAFIMACQ